MKDWIRLWFRRFIFLCQCETLEECMAAEAAEKEEADG